MIVWLVVAALVAPVAPSTASALQGNSLVTNKILASDNDIWDWFGVGVAAAGDLIVAAAPGDEGGTGAAYVYSYKATSGLTEMKLTASDGAPQDMFGGSDLTAFPAREGAVATDGTRVVVGAPGVADGAGAVYLFEPDESGGWAETKLTASDATTHDHFGAAVDMDEDRIVVGAPGAHGAAIFTGAVYVFEPDGAGGWAETKLEDAGTPEQSQLGFAVATSGSMVVAASRWYGQVVAFEKTTTGTWTDELLPKSGIAVDVYDGRVAIGGSSNEVYVLERDSGGTWLSSTITTVDATPFDRFGTSLDLDGNRLLVGADRYDDGRGYDVGAAYQFVAGAPGVWTESRLTAYDGLQADSFGVSVAGSGDRIVVGAPFHDDSPVSIGGHDRRRTSGAVYVFEPGAADWTAPTASHPYLTVVSPAGTAVPVTYQLAVVDNADPSASASCDPQSGSAFTPGTGQVKCEVTDAAGNVRPVFFRVTVIADETMIAQGGWELDLDGTTMVMGISGEPGWKVSAFEYTAGAWVETQLLQLDHNPWSNYAGYQVAISGQTIVAADHETAGGGIVYVFEPDGSGGWKRTDLQPPQVAPWPDFGRSVAISGDTLVAGAPGVRPGAAYVFTRQGGSWIQTATLTASDGGTNHGYGESVAIDGDRIIIGAPYVGDLVGAAYVYDRTSPASFVETKVTASDGTAGDSFGGSVAVSGDRIAIGTRLDDEENSETGEAAYIYELDAGKQWTETRLVPSDATSRDLYGWTVDVSGDIVAVSASYQFTPDHDYVGAVYIYTPDPGGGWREGKLVASSDSRLLGHSLAVSGNRIVAHGGSRPAGGGLTTYVFSLWPGGKCAGLPATIVGSSGNDVLLGTKGPDVIVGFGGKDLIRGRSGDDVICAGTGADTVFGGTGNDRIFAQSGFDTVLAGGGDDWVDGGRGKDILIGYAGKDILRGNDGDDTIRGYGGDDTIYGGDGDDRLFGYSGNDIIVGGRGDDTVFGGSGDDIIRGYSGNDTLHGNQDDDRIRGYSGDDTLNGGLGNDLLLGGADDDRLLGGPGDDIINGGAGIDDGYGGIGTDKCRNLETQSSCELTLNVSRAVAVLNEATTSVRHPNRKDHS